MAAVVEVTVMSPLAATVKQEGEEDEQWSQSAKTDRKGIAEITVDEGGRWVFQVERVADASPTNRDQYDKENFVTSLTMEIKP